MSLKLIAKLAAATLAMLAFTGAQYHGDRATIDFPDGWSVPVTDSNGIVTTEEAGKSANCNIQTRDLASIAGQTVAQINMTYAHAFAPAEWADFLGVKTSDLTAVSSDLRPFEDTYFHIATLRVVVDGTEVMVRYGFHILPGRVTMAGCYATVADFPKFSDLFERTVSSLRPR